VPVQGPLRLRPKTLVEVSAIVQDGKIVLFQAAYPIPLAGEPPANSTASAPPPPRADPGPTAEALIAQSLAVNGRKKVPV
jgi:hypothetical protein